MQSEITAKLNGVGSIPTEGITKINQKKYNSNTVRVHFQMT